MKTLELDHYNLKASREVLESLRLFYTDIVGLTDGYRPNSPKFGYWLYAGDRAVLHLTESPQDIPAPLGQTAFNHAAFNCSGLQAFQQRLSEQAIDYTTVRNPDLNRVQVFFNDPAGNGVELSFPEE